MRTITLISLSLSIGAQAGTAELIALAKRNGHKPSMEIVKTIHSEAIKAGIKPSKLFKIAMIESSFRTQAYRVNKNNTVDVGLFQINSVNFEKCSDLDLNSIRGNTQCAIRILKAHKKHELTDTEWFCRYHSKTPSKKANYCRTIASIK